MPFGISSAPEEYQRRISQELENLDGIAIVADDILIYGEGDTYEQALIDHDKKLESLLKRCLERNIKLNKDKMKLRLTELKYIGHLISKDGIRPDPHKVSTIMEMPPPTCVTELKRFMGMISYLSKFLPKISTITEPLRELERKDHQWNWTKQHQECYEQIKRLICEAPVLRYFNPDEEITL